MSLVTAESGEWQMRSTRLNTLVSLSLTILAGSLSCGGEAPKPSPGPVSSDDDAAAATPEMPVVLDSGK
jgi:hypothetical protein